MPGAGRLASLREKQRDLMEKTALQAALDDPRLWSVLFHAGLFFKDPWRAKLIDTAHRRFEGRSPSPEAFATLFTEKDDCENFSRLALERPSAVTASPDERLHNALNGLFDLAKKEKLVYVRNLIQKAGKHNDDAEMKRLLLAKKRVENSQLEWPLDRTPDLFAEKEPEPLDGLSGRA